jgi:hypothetical protein
MQVPDRGDFDSGSGYFVQLQQMLPQNLQLGTFNPKGRADL